MHRLFIKANITVTKLSTEGRGPCSLVKTPFSFFSLCIMYHNSNIILARKWLQEFRSCGLCQ